jgi:hypothetical protein
VILLASKIITPPSTAKKQHADAVFLNAVDLGVGFWNQFARECEYLVSILKEVKR